jgi:IS1 family transposase
MRRKTYPDAWIDRLNYYREGTPAEPNIKGFRGHYTVEVPESKLYDHGEDPLKIRQAVTEEQGYYNPTFAEKKLHEMGYVGVYNSQSGLNNAVAVFDALKPVNSGKRLSEGLASQAGKAGTPVVRSLAGASVGGATGYALPADTPEERRRNAVIGALAGAGAAYGVGKLVGGKAAQALDDPRFQATIKPRAYGQIVEEAEADEMWSYVRNKQTPRWLWPASDHHTGQGLAYVFGRREDHAFLELQSLLQPLGIRHSLTDGCEAYQRHLAPTDHSAVQFARRVGHRAEV